ncbi:AraC family transcriptional regulator [Paenibacillus sp. FSL H8-0548]|uniref:AraC family transcriptional regulator n=1 Tax=Paenibacillus sp. FSL H8-0548 TaxID=1920422 RepID=UPI00096F44AA|nr:AraC family transcriptional regulator [Paenibacillus sp. FSL H8-0548]OMF29416.1 AraC family transcriptional regulator [Paenibacillus sp. FSL H8-0548]
MIRNNEHNALSDLLQTLQLQLLIAHKTQVLPTWGEQNSVPEYNKLYFICEGEGWIRIGSSDYYPKPGQLFLTPAHTKVSFSTINNRPYLKYWCHFSIMAGPLDLFQWIGVPLCLNIEDSHRMTCLFQELIEWHEQDSIVARLREKSVLLEIVSHFLESVPIQVLQHRTEEMSRLSIIQQFVDSRLHTSINVEQIAEAVHLHPNYFSTYFKKHFGIPPLKYVSRKRTERAKQLLTTTSLSIKEIADQAGFKETNHFTKFFRKEAGLAPTEYRAAYTEQHPLPASHLIIKAHSTNDDGRN